MVFLLTLLCETMTAAASPPPGGAHAVSIAAGAAGPL